MKEAMKIGGNKNVSRGLDPTVLSTIDWELYNFNINPNPLNFLFQVNKKLRNTCSHFF